MRVVLDTSAAVSVVLGRDPSRRFAEALEEASLVLAPELLVPEVVNTFWKYHHFEKVPLDICDLGVERALALVDELVSCKGLYREAFLLARMARRSAYDMFYLALAKREDAVFLTADASLRKEAGRQAIRIG